jgi:hypothetical protein
MDRDVLAGHSMIGIGLHQLLRGTRPAAFGPRDSDDDGNNDDNSGDERDETPRASNAALRRVTRATAAKAKANARARARA